MNNKTAIIVAIVAVLLILGVGWSAANKKDANSGELYVSIKDATDEIINVKEIDLTIDKVELYNENEGWVTVSSDSETYQLLALKASGQAKLHAKEDVAAGTYDKVRVTLDDTNVRTESQGDVEAVMPAKVVTLDTNVKVNNGESSNLTLDFKADKSLHVTKSGKLVFAVVVEETAQNSAKVSVDKNDVVTVTGGSVDSNGSVGMDLDGSIKSDFELKVDKTFEVKSVTDGVVTFTLGGKDIIAVGSSDQDERQEDLDQNETSGIEAEGESESSLEGDTIDREEEERRSGGAGVEVEGDVNVKTIY